MQVSTTRASCFSGAAVGAGRSESLAAFFCAIYTLSVTLRAFFPVSDENRWKGKELTDPGWRMLLPIGIFTAVNVLLGIFPGPIMDFLGKIAAGAI